MIAVHMLCGMIILIIGTAVLPVTDGVMAAQLAAYSAAVSTQNRYEAERQREKEEKDRKQREDPVWLKQQSDLRRRIEAIRRQQAQEKRERFERHQAEAKDAFYERKRIREENERANKIKEEQQLLAEGKPASPQRPLGPLQRPPSIRKQNSSPSLQRPPSIRKQNSSSSLQRPPSIRKQNSFGNTNPPPKKRKGWKCWFGSCFRN